MGYTEVRQDLWSGRGNTIIHRAIRKVTIVPMLLMFKWVSVSHLNESYQEDLGVEQFDQVFSDGFRVVHKDVYVCLISNTSREEVLEKYDYSPRVVDEVAEELRGLFEYKDEI